MAINTSKVVVGGLAAGLVMNVIGYVVNVYLLGPKMMEEMVAVAPTLEGRGMSTGITVSRVAMQFIIGILLVWLYAAMRPRFGPGMRTASYAAAVIWLCGFVFYMDWMYMGMMMPVTYAIVSAVMLGMLLIAAWVGGKLYTEEGAAA